MCNGCPGKERADMKRNISDGEPEKLAKQLGRLAGLGGKRGTGVPVWSWLCDAFPILRGKSRSLTQYIESVFLRRSVL